MKKSVLFVVLVVLFIVATPTNHYKMQGEIVANDTIQDETGHIWEYDTNDFCVGDKVTITFQERGNENRRTDDIVKEIKKNA